MRKEIRLTSSQGVQSVNTTFPVAAISVENPTASPIYVRLGAPDTPTAGNADRTIPAAESRVIAASGQVFCFALANAALLAQSASSVGGLLTVANIILLSEDEITPSFGSASFLSLSTSQLSNGAQAFAPSPPANVYDLGPWGGAIFYFNPTGGQTNILVNVSNDAVTWYPLGNYALWTGVPSTVQVPRIMRYVNLEFFGTGIVGEPSPAGTFYVRGSIAEINDLVYTPSNSPIIKAVSLTGIQAQQFVYMTAGLPAVSLAYIATAGTTSGAIVTLLVEASADNLNWRKVTDRTQNMSQGITLYRALGNLDRFIRVTIFQNVAGQNEVGSLYASIPVQADLGYILNTIQQSLGDTGNATNTNQDIYHELDTIRVSNAAILALEASNLPYMPTVNGFLSTINNSDASIDTKVTQIPNIKTDTATIATNTTQIPNIKTDTATIATNTTQIPNIKTDTAALVVPLTNGTNVASGAIAVAAATWTVFGQIGPGSYIYEIQMSVLVNAGGAAGFYQFGLGNLIAPFQTLKISPMPASAVQSAYNGPTFRFDSKRSAGILMTVAQSYVWVYASAAGTVYINVSSST